MNISQHFERKEFACPCGCGFDTVDTELIEVLDMVRHKYGVPVHINSGARCPAWNAHVGGKTKSQHLYGRAADIVVEGIDAHEVYLFLNRTYPTHYGIGKYSTFTHIDTRSGAAARWRG